jgi:uncharacterized protein DUF4242
MFLIESYVPQLDERLGAVITSRLQEAVLQLAGEGATVQWLRSFALVGEETYLCLLTADSAQEAIRASERASVEYDHIVEVTAFETAL